MRAESLCELTGGASATIIGVNARGEPLLADGRAVLLPDLDRPDRAPWPERARFFLSGWLTGSQAILASLDPAPDRWGRAVARLYVGGGDGGRVGSAVWVEQRLVEEGLARVAPRRDTPACDNDLLAAEARARQASLGLWADPYYSVVPANAPGGALSDLADRDGRMIIVEGRILNLGSSGSRYFLNFGANKRLDLALVAPKLRSKAFEASNRPIPGYVGQNVRARGILDLWFGPQIEVDQPAQIEILAQPARSEPLSFGAASARAPSPGLPPKSPSTGAQKR